MSDLSPLSFILDSSSLLIKLEETGGGEQTKIKSFLKTLDLTDNTKFHTNLPYYFLS